MLCCPRLRQFFEDLADFELPFLLEVFFVVVFLWVLGWAGTVEGLDVDFELDAEAPLTPLNASTNKAEMNFELRNPHPFIL